MFSRAVFRRDVEQFYLRVAALQVVKDRLLFIISDCAVDRSDPYIRVPECLNLIPLDWSALRWETIFRGKGLTINASSGEITIVT